VITNSDCTIDSLSFDVLVMMEMGR
jgi:hypothetical protein